MRLTMRSSLGLLAAAALIAGCGSDDSSSQDQAQISGDAADRAFLNDMVPHHQAAVDIAVLARQRAQHPQLEQLAEAIVADQKAEIAEMGRLKQQAGGKSADTLGMDKEHMGMTMDLDRLRSAKPFDRAFIDGMVPHHEGAIAMAKMELKDGESARIKDLAQRIINAQQAEIKQMMAWRAKWYGAPAHGGDAGDDMHGSDDMH